MLQDKAATAVRVTRLGLDVMISQLMELLQLALIWNKILLVYVNTKPVNDLGHGAQQAWAHHPWKVSWTWG